MSTTDDTRSRIEELTKLIAYHQNKYHAEDAPEISDEAYDSLVAELRTLTGEDGPKEVFAVGAAPNEAFAKVTHAVRQWSFSNVFTHDEWTAWVERAERLRSEHDLQSTPLEFVAEHKVDGLKAVIEYRAGVLVRAATRGDGVTGEDVTHTVSTIEDLPHTLKKPVDLICVGEVWLAKEAFAALNKERAKAGEEQFANPRNAAAGSLRQLDPAVAAERQLSITLYDIDVLDTLDTDVSMPTTQWEELQLLALLGLPTNSHSSLCPTREDVWNFYERNRDSHDSLPFGVDGVVVKINSIGLQTALGYTAKSPRYGVAIKFPAQQATTVLEDVQLQVGRTGVITPVAHLRPVVVDGSTVSRATLHNEDEIKRLDVRIGDTVIIEKAGDIIPKVISVITELRPKKSKAYRFPKTVLGCGGDGSIERVPGEAAYRCVVADSDTLHRQRLYYFVSKQALNIDGVGPRIIDIMLDNHIIDDWHDLFTVTYGDLIDLPGFKDKAVQNILDAISAARIVPLYRLLIGLSINHIGEETARLIASYCGTLEKLQSATKEELAAIHGVGDIVAESVVAWFADSKQQKRLTALLEQIEVEAHKTNTSEVLKDATVVFTGTLENITRDQAKDMARRAGAQVSNSVSSKTTYVVAGTAAGSKLTKAHELGVATLTESEFIALIEQ